MTGPQEFPDVPDRGSEEYTERLRDAVSDYLKRRGKAWGYGVFSSLVAARTLHRDDLAAALRDLGVK